MLRRDGGGHGTLLLVEDDAAIERAVRVIVRKVGALQCVATVGEATQLIDRQRFMLAMVDLGLPDGSGLEVIAHCRRRAPSMPVLVLTVATAWPQVEAALRAGASGYLLKEDLATRLPGAIDEACRGGVALSGPIARGLVAATYSQAAPSVAAVTAGPSPLLTEREAEVLRLLAAGLSYEEVSGLLCVSVNTVRTHIRAMYDKLGVHNRTHAIAAARRNGWI